MVGGFSGWNFSSNLNQISSTRTSGCAMPFGHPCLTFGLDAAQEEIVQARGNGPETKILDGALESRAQFGLALKQRVEIPARRGKQRAIYVPENDFRVAHRKDATAMKINCLTPSSMRNLTIGSVEDEAIYEAMSDFHQSGVITTFHRLGKYNLEAIEATLAEYTERRPIALVLPCLYSELEGPALENILQHLRGVRYIRQVVVGLDRRRRQFISGGSAPVRSRSPVFLHAAARSQNPLARRAAPAQADEIDAPERPFHRRSRQRQ